MAKPKYDSTVAWIAGNIAGDVLRVEAEVGRAWQSEIGAIAQDAVRLARAIVLETQRTEPDEPQP